MRKWLDNIHKWFVYLAGYWGLPIGLLYFALTSAQIGILPQIFPKSASDWIYVMLTQMEAILPYLAGLLGLFWLALSIRAAIKDIRRWRKKVARKRRPQTTKTE